MIAVEIKENDKIVGLLTATEKAFKTGSRGYFGTGKVQIGENAIRSRSSWSRSGQNQNLKRTH